jgi:integron integrase
MTHKNRSGSSLVPTVSSQDSAISQNKPRLMDQIRNAIRLPHYSRRTEEAYLGWVRRFIVFHGKRHPAEIGQEEITRCLSSLAAERKVSASTQNQALSAILFLYRHVLNQDVPWLDDLVRAKRPQRLPVVLTRDEVKMILDQLQGTETNWLMAALLYGSGLRLSECLERRIKDVDFGASHILVRDGKGEKDRITLLPAVVRSALARQIERVRLQHQRDLAIGAGYVELPDALGQKYPNASREIGWQWVFPATRIYRDRVTGERRRHHLDESVLQRAVKEAIGRTEVTKLASCHTFRHYAESRTMPSSVAKTALIRLLTPVRLGIVLRVSVLRKFGTSRPHGGRIEFAQAETGCWQSHAHSFSACYIKSQRF